VEVVRTHRSSSGPYTNRADEPPEEMATRCSCSSHVLLTASQGEADAASVG